MSPLFVPGGTASQQELAVAVELTISAKCLLNKDILSKSDPMCVVYLQHSNRHAWLEQGRTERLANTLNPEFSTKVTVNYHFEELQNLKFKLYDIDGTSAILDDHDFLGEAECSLGQIVSSGNFSISLHHPDYSGTKNCGQLFVKAEEIGTHQEDIEILLSAQDLKKSFFFSKPSPFIEIYKENNLVYRTTHVNSDQNPQWPKFSLPMRSLRMKDGQDAQLIIKVLNHKDNGKHKILGEAVMTTKDFSSAPQTFNLVSKNNSNKTVGKLNLKEASVKKSYSFLDYILGGTQLSCTIAIDFTASNGSPNSVDSLHYIGPPHQPSPTLYEQVLQSVVTIIQDYDSDKQFPVLGFGAKVPPHGHLSHEFFVNLSPTSPYCAGVAGVVDAYRRCLLSIQLHGPTNFAPVINHVTRFAASKPNGEIYFILLILTDGVISDMRDTKEAIVEASFFPLSIIIVGIGKADFTSMNELDCDNGLLNSNGRYALRDIVQFVSFREFLNNTDPSFASQDLAKALLAEVPSQLVDYMKSKNIVPNTTSSVKGEPS